MRGIKAAAMFWRRKKPVESTASPAPMAVWRRGDSQFSTLSGGLLLARIAEAVTWCESRPSDATFWTKALAPSRLLHDGFDDVVCELGQARQWHLGQEKLPVPQEARVVAPGRFMLYVPDDNLCEGYAELLSQGFFDVENVPGHDTWVTFVDEVQRYLLAYVPVAAMAAADAGIRGNHERCIAWLDETPPPIRWQVERLVRRPKP